MGRVAPLALVCSALLILPPGRPAPAQDPARSVEARLMALPQPDGVVLRWFIVGGAFPADGVSLFRRSGRGEWTRVAGPMRQAARADLLARLPAERAETVRRTDEQTRAMTEERRARTAALRGIAEFLLACEFPELVETLAAGFTDPAPAGATYEYELRDPTGRVLGSIANLSPGPAAEVPVPAGLRAEVLPTMIRLTWTAAERGTLAGWEVHRSPTGADDWTRVSRSLIAAVVQEGAAPFFLDEAVEIGRSYSYALVARDIFGRPSARGDAVAVEMADVVPPAPPPAPVVTVGDAGATRIAWEPPAGDAAIVRLYRADQEDMQNPVVVGEYRGDTQETTQTLEIGTYYYYLRAVDDAGNESASSAVAMAGVEDLVPPGSPTEVAATGERGRITVQWRPPADADVAGYLVYRALTREASDFALMNAEPAEGPRYVDEIDEVVQNEFYYRVRAVDRSGNESALSEIAHARMPDVTPPSAPVMRAIRTGAGWIEIEWAPRLARDAAGFHVERLGEGDWERVTAEPLAADTRTYRDEDASGRREYRVICIDAAGHESAPSAALAGSLPDTSSAAAPQGLRGELLPSGRIRLQWDANPETDLLGYVVERSSSAEGPFRALGGHVTGTELEDRRVEAGATYYYRVVAYNQRGISSAPSAVVEVAVPEEEE